MGKIKTGAVVSANVQLTNEADTERQYAIQANVNIAGDKRIQTLTNGQVKDLEGAEKATFTRYAENNVGVNFKTADTQEQVKLLQAVNDFAEAAKTYVEGKNLVFE